MNKTVEQELREEIAKLRERIAVLEARPVSYPVTLNPSIRFGDSVGVPVWPSNPNTITCATSSGQSGILQS